MLRSKTFNRYIVLGDTVWMELTPACLKHNPEGFNYWTKFHVRHLPAVQAEGRWYAGVTRGGGKKPVTVYAMRMRQKPKPYPVYLHVFICEPDPAHPEKWVVDHKNGHGLNNLDENLKRTTNGKNVKNGFDEPRVNHLEYPPEVLAIMFPANEAVKRELVEA